MLDEGRGMMMLKWNNLEQYKESNRIEAKKAVGGLPRDLWETYSAFANTQGGVLLLGVEERADKSLYALDLPDPEKLVKEFWDIVNNRQKVSVNILTNKHVQIIEVDGHRIVAIDIPRANRMDKPIYIGADPFAGSYRRNGEGDYHCTADEVRNMMRDQSNIPQDSRVLEKLGLDAFDYESVRHYRTRLQNTRSNHVWENLEPVEFLQKLGGIGRAEDGTLHPTAAGILMFGFEYEIVKEYPAYFLDYQEHDNETTRWTHRVVSNLGDWNGNLFDFYFRVCNRLTEEVKVPFKLEGMTRIDDTPVHKALREALANALIHANYYDRLGLVIHRRPQSITIANPGGLRISVEDALVGGISDPRNFTLFKLFNMLNVGERAGSGIPNIYHVWDAQGWQKPKLTEEFNPERTILSLVFAPQESRGDGDNVGDSGDNIGDSGDNIGDKTTQEKIIELMCLNPKISASKIAKAIGVSNRNVELHIQKMKADGVIDRQGSPKGGRWIVKGF